MHLLDALSKLLGHHSAPAKPVPQAPTWRLGIQPLPQGGYNFTGGARPIQNNIQIPQNLGIPDNISRYGTAQGNQWWENNDTGQRYPIPRTPLPFDAPIPRVQTMPGQFTLPIQYRNPQLIKPIGIQA